MSNVFQEAGSLLHHVSSKIESGDKLALWSKYYIINSGQSSIVCWWSSHVESCLYVQPIRMTGRCCFCWLFICWSLSFNWVIGCYYVVSYCSWRSLCSLLDTAVDSSFSSYLFSWIDPASHWQPVAVFVGTYPSTYPNRPMGSSWAHTSKLVFWHLSRFQ